MRKYLSILLLGICLSVNAQETPAGDTLKIAFITDLHIGDTEGPAVDDLRACIEDINAQSLDFVIVGGDLTDFGSDAQFAFCKMMLDSLAHPWWTVAGNHDAKWSESGCNSFVKVYGYEQFCFKVGQWRFIGCNSGPDMRMAPALIPKESLLYLDSLPREKSIFINHYPIDSTMLNYGELRAKLSRIDTRYCLGGHFHSNIAKDYGSGLRGAVMRSTLRGKGKTGYSIIYLTDTTISIAEKHPGEPLQQPWLSDDVSKPCDPILVDAHGLTEDYPWMNFEVNEAYPEVRELWHKNFGANIASGFAISDDGSLAYFCTESGLLYCIWSADGSIKWKYQLPGKVFSTPAFSSNKLIIGCTDGYIYSFNALKGKLRWRHKADASILSSRTFLAKWLTSVPPTASLGPSTSPQDLYSGVSMMWKALLNASHGSMRMSLSSEAGAGNSTVSTARTAR